MAAPAFDGSKPNASNVWNTDVDQIRDNQYWVMMAAAGAGYMLPDWDTTATGTDLAEPDAIYMEHKGGTLKMKWAFTWATGGEVTQVVWSFDSGSGYETLTNGTIAVSYDGSGNFSGMAAT